MLGRRRISLTQDIDTSAFERPLSLAVPDRVEAAIARGVRRGRDFPFANAAQLIEPGGDGLTDAVVRNSDGVLVVACRTDMPDVSPQMWDWWFGWHSVSSKRYRLWHPRDHLSAALAEDRTRWPDVKARYIGNVSFVEEFIGEGEIHKLSIAFKAPSEFGLDERKVAEQGTAICARGGLPHVFADVSHLIHFVRRTPGGSEMLSRFWLGDVRSKIPVVGGLIDRRLNDPAARIENSPDAFGLKLLRHCSEEMSHLAKILPGLYSALR